MPRRLVSSLARGIHHLFLLAACAACSTARPPDLQHAVDTPWGVVRAARQEDAIEVAAVVERVAPKISTWIPECGSAALDIRLVQKLGRSHWGGATITTAEARWIELPEGERTTAAQAILAHELVHYWLGGAWIAMPAVLEEGLAIHIAHKAVPQAAPLERGELALVLGTLLDGSVTFAGPAIEHGSDGPKLSTRSASYTLHARIDMDELPILRDMFELRSDELAHTAAPGVRAVLDALAYVVVERIGIDKLHRLCEQALLLGHPRIPSAWIWSAARIDPDEPVSLERATREMLGTAEIRALILSERLLVAPPQAGADRTP